MSVLTFLGALLLVACKTGASSSNNQVATSPVGTTSLSAAAKIKPGLAAKMTALAGSKTKQGFFVKLREQAKFDDRPASMSQNDYANMQMEEVAKRTQPSVALVIKQLIQRGEADRYVAYVIVNGFYVVELAEAVRVLSELPEVEYLEEDGTLRQPQCEAEAELAVTVVEGHQHRAAQGSSFAIMSSLLLAQELDKFFIAEGSEGR